MSVTIYHNPRCTKSRQTLALLEQRGIQPRIVEYLVTPPTEAELKRLLKLLGISPRELLRAKEEEYKQAKLDKPGVTDTEIIHAMIKYPRLMERPIVVVGNKAALGSAAGECIKNHLKNWSSFPRSLSPHVISGERESRRRPRAGGEPENY